jgi:hypothetical protein
MKKTTKNISKNHALPGAASEKERFVVRRKLLRERSGERNEDNPACL